MSCEWTSVVHCAMNAVSSLVERDPRGVRRMISRLGDLLRHSIEGASVAEVPLRQELDLLARYVDIMQVRFQGRLEVELRVDERARDALVPNMILQPIVENAIRHGVERREGGGGGRITIEAGIEADDVVLRVIDDGPGPGGDGTRAGGVGVRNTIARLEQLYGSGDRFALRAAVEGGAVAEVRIPYRTRTDLHVIGVTSADPAEPATIEAARG